MKKIILVALSLLLSLLWLSGITETFDLDDCYPLTLQEVNAGILYDPVSRFSYALQADGTIRLVRYIEKKEVDIPETINGIPVSSLGRHAFANTTVSDIFLSTTDIRIDDLAFVGCDATIWIPGSQLPPDFLPEETCGEHKYKYYTVLKRN